MLSHALNARCCALALLLWAAQGQDDVALLQHSVSPRTDTAAEVDAESFQQVLAGRSAEEIRATAPQFSLELPDAALDDMVEAGKRAAEGRRDALARGWKAFYERSREFVNPKPQQLLQTAKLALVETGAMEEMRQVAVAAANASRGSSWNWTKLMTLNSMMVGFKATLAPWNNVLVDLRAKLIKASFSIFGNFWGPEGKDSRLCISVFTVVDSKYGVHERWEFGGVNAWFGPANWDHVPGWNIGAAGGTDGLGLYDMADLGFLWTLAKRPEASCFYWDLCLIDSWDLHPSALQTQSEHQTAEDGPRLPFKKHGSAMIGHTWCSPEWYTAPLRAKRTEEPAAASMEAEEEVPQPGAKAAEWDPESEPV